MLHFLGLGSFFGFLLTRLDLELHLVLISNFAQFIGGQIFGLVRWKGSLEFRSDLFQVTVQL